MSKYKITAIKTLLKNNQTAVSGDVVDESKFVNLQDSLKRGICEEVDSDEDDTRTESEIKADENLKVVKKYNKADLILFAQNNKIEFNEEDNKKAISTSVLPKVDENSVLLTKED